MTRGGKLANQAKIPLLPAECERRVARLARGAGGVYEREWLDWICCSDTHRLPPARLVLGEEKAKHALENRVVHLMLLGPQEDKLRKNIKMGGARR